MHSVVDWFAFARRNSGQLVRSLSLSPDSGIMEDIGQRFSFEEPFWSGQPDDSEDDYPFPFHPLELGEAALKEWFGYQLEGLSDRRCLNPIRYRSSNTSVRRLAGSSGKRQRRRPRKRFWLKHAIIVQ